MKRKELNLSRAFDQDTSATEEVIGKLLSRKHSGTHKRTEKGLESLLTDLKETTLDQTHPWA